MKPTKNLNKMTAVEFLAKQALNYLNDEQENDLIKVIQQALEMEKQQIVKAYKDGVTCLPFDDKDVGEQYYNETYKKP
jgi:hypothetical protein